MPKRKSYSVRVKLVIVASVQNGESEANVSHDISVPQSAICGWLKDEQKLCDSSDGMKRKNARTANDPELDKAGSHGLWESQAGTPISGPVLSVQWLRNFTTIFMQILMNCV